MKIVLFGDSITDAGRNRSVDYDKSSYGFGYPSFIAGELLAKDPNGYDIINRGISGNRVVDLYARIKADVWNLQPDVLSILIGINDIWHELGHGNGVDLVRYEKIYRMLIEDTKERLPKLKIVICEPFVLEGAATKEKYAEFLEVKKYAKVAKRLAEEYGLYYLPLQETLDKAAEKYGAEKYLSDGVHPTVAGAKLIADEWLALFKKEIEK
ncbi:MAG: SGNH/GDSL hydrolase family protein [Clostridia bacterium]|nr:SGNH/GDSL hydrolase family protein [Clostridia bacterium]